MFVAPPLNQRPRLSRVEVAVPIAQIAHTLTYAVPAAMRDQVQIGQRVRVRVAGRRVVGLIFGVGDEAFPKPMLLEEILDQEPVVTAAQLALCRFVADYYLSPIGECTRLILPPDTARTITRRYKLTESGGRAQVFGAALDLTSKEQTVLNALEFNLAQSARAVGTTPARLDKLVAQGLVTMVEDRAAGAARIDERVLLLEDGEPLPPRAIALAALDAWLRTLEFEPRVSEVQISFPGARGKLKKLAALGRLNLEEEVRVGPVREGLERKAPAKNLSVDQRSAIARLKEALQPPTQADTPKTGATKNAEQASDDAGPPPPPQRSFLLEGVTGSGKTEVYLEALSATLQAGRGALLVVPEIALTPQLLARVEGALPHASGVVVLHSGLGKAERRDAWLRLLRGEAQVALGARSALFAPVPNLGLIVVDEEHEPSLKQDESPRYHGRDVALWRARHEGAVCILGSATPSLESRHNVALGKLERLSLPTRATGEGKLPEVEIIDLRERGQMREKRRADRAHDGGGVVLSAPLLLAMRETLAAGEQVLLFLNRRGWSSVVLCDACGEAVQCPHCTVSLTWHRGKDQLVCHQCDYQRAVPDRCPSCQQSPLMPIGLGTERVQGEVEAALPEARVARLDRDTVAVKGGMLQVLLAIQRREVDVIIGTQMVAKGHDFPHIALVGVVLADVALGVPDFRAAERAFALLTQVAGRAGRGETPGRVLIQTYQPDHPAIMRAQTHDVVGFAEAELSFREEAHYPPFWRVAILRVEGEDATAVDARARQVAEIVRARARALVADAQGAMGAWDVLGPAPSGIERVRGKTRHQVFLRCKSVRDRARILGAVLRDEALREAISRSRCRLVLDVDPISVV